MSISKKIAFGFGLIIVMMLGTIMLGLYYNSKIKGGSDEAHQLTKFQDLIHKLDREVLVLQQHVLIFSKTGHASLLKQVERANERMRGLTEEIEVIPMTKAEGLLFEKVKNFQQNYMESFHRFAEDRQEKEQQTQGLRAQAESIKKRFVAIVQKDVSMLHAQSLFIESLNRVNLYLEEPNSSEVRSFREKVDAVNFQVMTLQDPGLMMALDKYVTTFSDLVQSVRGNLFLSNVVLAGQAAEFRYNSREFRRMVELKTEKILQRLASDSEKFIFLEVVISIVSIVVVIFSSMMIGRSITMPLDKIKETFNVLSKGGRVDEIPGLKASDEIGEMAKAAQVFKEKNQETKALLDKSQMTEKQLQEQALELERANAELEQFAYVASHDLQEPLRMVSSYVQLLAQEYGEELGEDAMEYIGFASEGSKRMQLLINDLLDLSRVGRVETKYEEVSSKEIMALVCKDMEEPIQASGVKIELGELLTVRAVPLPLQQVFQNFLTNAIKYRKKEEALIFKVDSKDLGSHWEFRFEDNGIGIDPKHHDRIFKIFQRLHSRKDYEGSGMGLAIVKKIADQHQGDVRVESELGKGCVFYFSIKKVEA